MSSDDPLGYFIFYILIVDIPILKITIINMKETILNLKVKWYIYKLSYTGH